MIALESCSGRTKPLDAGMFQPEISSFRLHLAAEGKAAKTVRTYTDAVQWFAAAYLRQQGNRTCWEGVKKGEVQEWVAGVHGRDLRAPGHSPARTPRQCGPFSEARPGRPQGQAPPNGMALRRAVFEDPQFR